MGSSLYIYQYSKKQKIIILKRQTGSQKEPRKGILWSSGGLLPGPSLLPMVVLSVHIELMPPPSPWETGAASGAKLVPNVS